MTDMTNTELADAIDGDISSAIQRLIAGAFRRDGERLDDGKRPRFSIPCRPAHDDDTVVLDALAEAALREADQALTHARQESELADMPYAWAKDPSIDGMEAPWFMRAEDRVEDWHKRVFTIPLYDAPTLTLARQEATERAGRRVYLDLDGVMADFDAHFPATFGLDHRSMADDAMWQTINEHPSYFRDMPPCPGAIEFFRSIEHLGPIILTACPRSNYAHVARQKRAWVREHLSGELIILPVMGGRNKCLFMHAPGDILIDDFERNTKAWEAEGGTAILHRNFAETSVALASAVRN